MVCYFTHYSQTHGLLPEDVDPKLCTHLVTISPMFYALLLCAQISKAQKILWCFFLCFVYLSLDRPTSLINFTIKILKYSPAVSLFALLGSSFVKALQKYWWIWPLESISPTFYINLSCTQIPKAQNRKSSFQCFLCLWVLHMQKLLIKHLWNWPQVYLFNIIDIVYFQWAFKTKQFWIEC